MSAARIRSREHAQWDTGNNLTEPFTFWLPTPPPPLTRIKQFTFGAKLWFSIQEESWHGHAKLLRVVKNCYEAGFRKRTPYMPIAPTGLSFVIKWWTNGYQSQEMHCWIWGLRHLILDLRFKTCNTGFEAQEMYCWILGSRHLLLHFRLKKSSWIWGSGNILLDLTHKKCTVGC
jgi:hypothetical protein